MRHGIPEFRARQPLDRQLTAVTLNDIRKELESLRIIRVNNGTFRKLPGGTEITVAPQRGGGGAASETHPFQVVAFADPDGDPEAPSYLATVRPGTINNLLPSNIFSGAEQQEFSIASDQLQYVVLTSTTDGKRITAASLSVETSAPAAQTPVLFGLPTSIETLIAVVYNTNVFQVVKDNITLTGKIVVTTSKASPGPGELAFDTWYQWG